MSYQEAMSSWTDDLPVCRQSGIGFVSNEKYRMDGRRTEMHPNEDRYFHFSVGDSGVQVYGVFDGFSGEKVSDFIHKKIPAELCLGQVSPHSTDDAIRDVLRQAFISIDRDYFNFIDEILAKRMAKRLDNPTDPNLVQLDHEAMSGASATVAVVLNNKKLFVANTGDVRAVICSLKPDGDVRALPLSIDHLVTNEDEQLRLTQLGLNVSQVMKITERTRCLGLHQAKGGYKEVDYLKEAVDEPVLAIPEIHGPFNVESNHLFMLIYTRSLAACLEQIEGSFIGDVNTELCRIAKQQFCENTTVSGVAQSVVDKVARNHRDYFETEFGDTKTGWQREDISLLVRNFNAKLKAHSPPKRSKSSTSSKSGANSPNIAMNNNLDAVTIVTEADSVQQQKVPIIPPEATRSSTTTDTSSTMDSVKQDKELSLNENGRIKAYVDFSHFHKQWALFQAKEQNGFEK